MNVTGIESFNAQLRGFLSCIVSYDLGNRCLDLLRRMMLSSDHCLLAFVLRSHGHQVQGGLSHWDSRP